MGKLLADKDVPPRHKSAVITVVGLLAPVHFIPPALDRKFPEQPLLVLFLAVATIVALMTYCIMPVLTFVFTKWLYPRKTMPTFRHTTPEPKGWDTP